MKAQFALVIEIGGKTMNYNKGEQQENIMVQNLNNHHYKDLIPNLRNIVEAMFPDIKEDDLITASLIEGYIKPDFSVTVNNVTHYVSMKSGVNNIVNQEYIQNFCKLLKEKGISSDTIRVILYFHYGDGTYDGSGKERMSYTQLRSRLERYIPSANEELNRNKDLVMELIHRFLFKGTKEENIEAEFIYDGELESGIILSRDQIMRHCEHKNWDFYEALHIGPFLFRPHARYHGREIKNKIYRERIEFYWPNMLNYFRYISTHYPRKRWY